MGSSFLEISPMRFPLLFLLAAVMVSACATTGSTFNSGVGDAFPDHPPYYSGSSPAAIARDTTPIGHLPVTYQRGAAQPAMFDPTDGASTPIAALVAEMNAFLDSLSAGKSLATSGAPRGSNSNFIPPDVQFGCGTLPGEDCAERGDSALGRDQRMRLAVGIPSPSWAAWHRELASTAGVERTLLITLEVGQYLIRQKGWSARKEVELGTGHVQSLPWLTSLEEPVVVLQLTGALLDRDGRAIRIGAEGILARRTPLVVSALGVQEVLTDADIQQVRQLRRNEIAGQPLAWQVAMRQLVAQLSGEKTMASR
jgi:hypothetical protein